MAVKFKYICDRCGKISAELDEPVVPLDWYFITFYLKGEKPSWSESKLLCDECVNLIRNPSP